MEIPYVLAFILKIVSKSMVLYLYAGIILLKVKRLRVGPKVGPTALLIKFTTFKHNYDNTNTGFNIIAVPVQA